MSKQISLQTLTEGAAGELFDLELQKLNDNVSDPNMKAETVREVILKVRFKPNKDRDRGALSISVTSKLAPHNSHEALVWFGTDTSGCPMAMENNPNQEDFNFAPDGVTSINQKKEVAKND